MAELSFSVPGSFWTDHTPAAVHLRRLAPGKLEVLSTELAEAFLAGSGSLALPSGWHELVEIQLSFVTLDSGVGIKPRLHMRRVPVAESGRIDGAIVTEDAALPESERRAKHGWWPNGDEHAAMQDAIERLISSEMSEAADPVALTALATLLMPGPAR